MDPEMAATVGKWFALCHRSGVSLAAATEMSDVLVTAYAEPHRHYHTLGHIQDCLNLAAQVPLSEQDRDATEFALWFHDIVYDTRASDNEERSAVVAQDWLAQMGIGGGQRVGDLIRMTAGHNLDADAEQTSKVVHDVDLAILGASPSTYDRYVQDIRMEYRWVPDAEFRAGRGKVLRAFNETPLYVLEGFAEMFTDQAAKNIARELASLGPA